jgi:hypothetical protein
MTILLAKEAFRRENIPKMESTTDIHVLSGSAALKRFS